MLPLLLLLAAQPTLPDLPADHALRRRLREMLTTVGQLEPTSPSSKSPATSSKSPSTSSPSAIHAPSRCQAVLDHQWTQTTTLPSGKSYTLGSRGHLRLAPSDKGFHIEELGRRFETRGVFDGALSTLGVAQIAVAPHGDLQPMAPSDLWSNRGSTSVALLFPPLPPDDKTRLWSVPLTDAPLTGSIARRESIAIGGHGATVFHAHLSRTLKVIRDRRGQAQHDEEWNALFVVLDDGTPLFVVADGVRHSKPDDQGTPSMRSIRIESRLIGGCALAQPLTRLYSDEDLVVWRARDLHAALANAAFGDVAAMLDESLVKAHGIEAIRDVLEVHMDRWPALKPADTFGIMHSDDGHAATARTAQDTIAIRLQSRSVDGFAVQGRRIFTTYEARIVDGRARFVSIGIDPSHLRSTNYRVLEVSPRRLFSGISQRSLKLYTESVNGERYRQSVYDLDTWLLDRADDAAVARCVKAKSVTFKVELHRFSIHGNANKESTCVARLLAETAARAPPPLKDGVAEITVGERDAWSSAMRTAVQHGVDHRSEHPHDDMY